MSEFLEQTYAKGGTKIERKVLSMHKSRYNGFSEAAAKAEYIKLAQNLPTFGTTFFLVKVGIVAENM